jgi:hypothetical protein
MLTYFKIAIDHASHLLLHKNMALENIFIFSNKENNRKKIKITPKVPHLKKIEKRLGNESIFRFSTYEYNLNLLNQSKHVFSDM